MSQINPNQSLYHQVYTSSKRSNQPSSSAASYRNHRHSYRQKMYTSSLIVANKKRVCIHTIPSIDRILCLIFYVMLVIFLQGRNGGLRHSCCLLQSPIMVFYTQSDYILVLWCWFDLWIMNNNTLWLVIVVQCSIGKIEG